MLSSWTFTDIYNFAVFFHVIQHPYSLEIPLQFWDVQLKAEAF